MNVKSGHKFDLNMGAILQALILAALLWVGTSINTLNAQMAAVQVQVGDIADAKRRLNAAEIELARLTITQNANVARLSRLEGHE